MIDSLVGVLDRARTEYFARGHAMRSRFLTTDRQRIISFGWGVPKARGVDRVRAVAGPGRGRFGDFDRAREVLDGRSLRSAFAAVRRLPHLGLRLLESRAATGAQGDLP
jgi:hypothetical protein